MLARNYFKIVIVLLLSAIPCPAEVSLRVIEGDKPYLKVTVDNNTPRIIRLERLQRKTSLFHWTHREWAEEVVGQGGLTNANMEYFQNKGKKVGFQQFGGFYTSVDMWDSAWYGETLLIINLEKDILLVPFKPTFSKDLMEAFRNDPILLQNRLKQAGVSGSYLDFVFGRRRWINIFDATATCGARIASKIDFEDSALSQSYLFKEDLFERVVLQVILFKYPQLYSHPEFSQKLKRHWPV